MIEEFNMDQKSNESGRESENVYFPPHDRRKILHSEKFFTYQTVRHMYTCP